MAPAPRCFAISADGRALDADGERWVPLGAIAWELFRLAAAWLDPRSGASTPIGEFARDALPEFTPPPNGPEWALTLVAA